MKTTTEKEWALRFREIAEVVKTWSKDESTKIGAVIADDDHTIISTGYNSFPRGIVDNLPERQERPEKYFWFAHGERNSIYNAARNGVSIKGATMYLTCGVPCTDCAIGIINSGIKKVWISRPLSEEDKNKPWYESGKRSVEMLKEAGVEVEIY